MRDFGNRVFGTTIKVITFWLAAIVLVALSVGPASADMKIGSIDVQKVLAESDAGKATLATMKKTLEAERTILEGKVAEIKALAKEIEQQKMMMLSETLEKKEREFASRKREFELYRKDTEGAFQKKQARVMRGLYKEIKELTGIYARDNGYQLIFEQGSASPTTGPVFVYFDSSIEVTDDIIKLLDAKKKADAKAAK